MIVSGDDAVLPRAHPGPVADVRLAARARSCSTSSCTTPDAATTSTAPPFASRNYTIADDSAWSRRIEVQGFASPVFVDAAGAVAGHRCRCTASQASRYITMFVPLAALGTPGPGWSFAVVLHGQDGFSSDQARGFQPTPQAFQFGLCATADVGQPDLQHRPGRGAEGDGRDHPGRRRPVRRARPDARAGADRRGAGGLSVAVWSPTAMNCTDFLRFVTNRAGVESVGRPPRFPGPARRQRRGVGPVAWVSPFGPQP